MPIPGQTIFETLQAALPQVREQAAQAHQAVAELDERLARLVSQRSDVIRELSRHALPELSRAAIDQGYDAVRMELLAILERKERRTSEITGRMQRLKQEVDQENAKAQAAGQELLEAQSRHAELQATLSKTLAKDPEFQKLSHQVIAEEAELERDEERVIEIRKEASEKLPAYHQSSLFQYLQSQRYATAEYAGRGLIRRLDRWVASLVEYEKASRSYRFLQTTPKLMDDETARRKAEFHGRMQQLEAMGNRLTEELGVEVARRKAEESQRFSERQAARLEDAEQRLQAVQAELNALDQQQGQFYEEASGRLKAYVSRAEMALLEQKAQRTPDPEDDDLTLQLRDLTSDIAALESEISRVRESAANATRRSEGLEYILRRFEQANFTDIRSHFRDGYDVRNSLSLYRSGVLSRDAFWEELKRNQERIPTEFEQRTAEKLKKTMNGPLVGAVGEAMLTVAGEALREVVTRSMNRRL